MVHNYIILLLFILFLLLFYSLLYIQYYFLFLIQSDDLDLISGHLESPSYISTISNTTQYTVYSIQH